MIQRPLVIVFEDLHWADESTRHLVDAITAQIARRPCVAIVTYRPGFVDPWATKSYYTHLRIDALAPEDSRRMIDHLVGDDASVERWKSSVVGLAGGTPLFIEEVVRSARAAGTLIGVDGRFRVTDETAPSRVASSLRALVADRVDRLSEGARDILSIAAVLGRDVPASLMHALIPDSLVSRSDDLDELQAAELLFATRYRREPGYVFRHALTQEVAYREMPQSVRREHHRKIAQLLETLTSAEDNFSPELLARHHAGTARQQFQASWGLWFVHLMRGEIHTAQQLGNEVFELAQRLDDKSLQLEAHHVQWSGLSLAGNPTAVREHAQICIQQYQPSEHHWLTFSYGGHDPGVCARNLDAMALWLLGEPVPARARSTSAIKLAEDLGHPYTRLESFNSALNIALLDNDADALFTHANVLQALVDGDTLPDFASAYANGFRANALVFNGDVTAGLQLMIESAPVWQEFWGAWCFPLDSAFATTLAAVGRIGEAVLHVEKQLRLSELSGAHWWEAEFHRVLGELSLAGDSAELNRGAASFDRALQTARQQQVPFLELRAAISLARLHSTATRADAVMVTLQKACNQFTSHADTTDLRLARSILRQAAPSRR